MRNFWGMPVRIRETKGTSRSRRGPAKPPRDREFPLTRAEHHSRRGRSQGIREDPVLLSEAGIRLAGSRSPRPPFRRVRKTVRSVRSVRSVRPVPVSQAASAASFLPDPVWNSPVRDLIRDTWVLSNLAQTGWLF